MSTVVVVNCSEPDRDVWETYGKVIRHERIRSGLWRVVYAHALDARDAVHGLPASWEADVPDQILCPELKASCSHDTSCQLTLVTLQGFLEANKVTQCLRHALDENCPPCIQRHFPCLDRYHKQTLTQQLQAVSQDPNATFDDLRQTATRYYHWHYSDVLYEYLVTKKLDQAALALLPLLPTPNRISYFKRLDLTSFRQAVLHHVPLPEIDARYLEDPDSYNLTPEHCQVLAQLVRQRPGNVVTLLTDHYLGVDRYYNVYNIPPEHKRHFKLLLQRFKTWYKDKEPKQTTKKAT